MASQCYYFYNHKNDSLIALSLGRTSVKLYMLRYCLSEIRLEILISRIFGINLSAHFENMENPILR